MKGTKKKEKSTLKQGLLIFGIFLIVIIIGLIFQLIYDALLEPHYKITLDGKEISQTEMYNLLFNENASNINNLNLEWLNKNCECISKRECSIHYNWSQVYRDYTDKGGGTYDGPIEYTESGGAIFFEKGAQVVEECEPCKEYICGDGFKVEIWNK